MQGLILKDVINLKKNFKMFSAFILIYIFMSIAMDNSSYFSSMFTLVFAMLTLSTYSFDEMAKWDGYALTMPIIKENMVQGKYLVMLLLATIGVVFNFVILTVLNIVMKSEHLYTGYIGGVIGVALVILFYSIAIPFITKYGVEKSRFIIIAIYMIPFFIGSMIFKALKERYPQPPKALVELGEFCVEYAVIIIPVIVLLALSISYLISVRIYLKKEF